MAYTRPGGVRSTIFNLLNATAGAAVIAIPGAFRESGLAFSFFQLILACGVNFISSSCLVGFLSIQLYTSYEWNCFSYSQIALNCYGKAFAKFVDIVFFINIFGTTLSYAVMIQGNMVTAFGFLRNKFWENMPRLLDDPNSIFWVVLFSVGCDLTQCTLIPLVVKRQLKSLTIYSFLGFLTIIYIMILTILYCFNPNVSFYYSEFEHIKSFHSAGCLVTFPVFIFSFTTQINLLQCFSELEIPTLRRMHKVLAKQHFICFSIYLFIGVFGYLSFPMEDDSFSTYLLRFDAVRHTPVLIVD